MDDSRKLNAQNVSLMMEDLQEELSDYIDNQAQIAAIVKKWRARKDLVGKTKADVTALLYADVKSIVKDKETLDDGTMAGSGCAVGDLNSDKRADVTCISGTTLKWYENK